MVMNQKLLDEWNFPWYRDRAIGHENTHSRLPEIVLFFMRNSFLINDFIKNQMGSSLVFTMDSYQVPIKDINERIEQSLPKLDLLLTVVQVPSEADFVRFMIACRWNFSKVNNKRFQG